MSSTQEMEGQVAEALGELLDHANHGGYLSMYCVLLGKDGGTRSRRVNTLANPHLMRVLEREAFEVRAEIAEYSGLDALCDSAAFDELRSLDEDLASRLAAAVVENIKNR